MPYDFFIFLLLSLPYILLLPPPFLLLSYSHYLTFNHLTHTSDLKGLADFIRQAEGNWRLLSLDQRLLAICGFDNAAAFFRGMNPLNFNILPFPKL